MANNQQIGTAMNEIKHTATDAAVEMGIQESHVKAKGADAAFAYASIEALTIDEATNKRLLRKIDSHVLPWLCTLYVLQYLDKGV